jgi:hypothetical protein
MTLSVEWVDFGREPKCAPDPEFPAGKDLALSTLPAEKECVTTLPYPAKRCGMYIVKCETCGLSVGVTTAGRADDPRSVRVMCLQRPN